MVLGPHIPFCAPLLLSPFKDMEVVSEVARERESVYERDLIM